MVGKLDDDRHQPSNEFGSDKSSFGKTSIGKCRLRCLLSAQYIGYHSHEEQYLQYLPSAYETLLQYAYEESTHLDQPLHRRHAASSATFFPSLDNPDNDAYTQP